MHMVTSKYAAAPTVATPSRYSAPLGHSMRKVAGCPLMPAARRKHILEYALVLESDSSRGANSIARMKHTPCLYKSDAAGWRNHVVADAANVGYVAS